MTAFDKAWNSITKADMPCSFCGEPFDIYDIRDFDDSPGIEAFRKYGCGAFKTPQKECKSDPINKAWDFVKGSNCATHNCEDNCTEKDWSYCGKKDCASCGGGCGDDDCRKCNPDAKW